MFLSSEVLSNGIYKGTPQLSSDGKILELISPLGYKSYYRSEKTEAADRTY